MRLDGKLFFRRALLIVAIAYLLYNIYQAVVTTIFISHFPAIVRQLPNIIESSQPELQIGLFLLQEIISSIGVYLRLVGGIFAVYATVLFVKQDQKYFNSLSRALLFESLYFALLIPAGINHIVGLAISSSQFLNGITGVSFLLQAALIFPPLFMLSRKLKNPQNRTAILRWASIAAPLYVLGIWVKHALMWVYALSPQAAQQASIISTIGSANSLLTLLAAAVVTTAAAVIFRQKNNLNSTLAGTALILIGTYFAVYAIVSVWAPTYLAFLPLTEFWMITLLILGIAALFNPEKDRR